MSHQLTADCLNEIFEYLRDEVDGVSLRSCLLVNRFWCEISVRILWTSIQNYNTLIACLPHESKEILYENEIIISTPTSEPPLFNYATFINNLSIIVIIKNIQNLFKNHRYQFLTSQEIDNKIIVVTQEIFKMFMKHISLKTLYFYYEQPYFPKFAFFSNIPFTIYPEAIDCLRNLSELGCRSDLTSEFFYQLSQLCHNIQTLSIIIENVISNGLAELISVQRNLKYLSITQRIYGDNLKVIVPLLKKFSNTIIKLNISLKGLYMPLSFISEFTNLKELAILFYRHDEYFKNLQHVTFPKL